MVVGYNVFQSALGPLADALAVGILGDRIHDYGRIRYLSSLSYAVVGDRVRLPVRPDGLRAGAVSVGRLAGGARGLRLSFVREPRRVAIPGAHRRGGSARLAFHVQPRLPFVLPVFGLMFFAILGAYTFFNIRLAEVGGQPSDIALGGGLAGAGRGAGDPRGRLVVRRIGLRGLFAGSAIWYSLGILSWAVLDQVAGHDRQPRDHRLRVRRALGRVRADDEPAAAAGSAGDRAGALSDDRVRDRRHGRQRRRRRRLPGQRAAVAVRAVARASVASPRCWAGWRCRDPANVGRQSWRRTAVLFTDAEVHATP